MAAGTVIYSISGDAALRIRNAHEDLTSRPAAEAVIYGIFGDAAPEIGNTHWDSTPRAAKKANTIEELQSRAPNLQCFVGPLGVQVVRFAGGTRFWPGRTAKSRHIRDPGRPVCARHADSAPLDRKNLAPRWSGGAGGAAGKPREQESQKSTSEMHT